MSINRCEFYVFDPATNWTQPRSQQPRSATRARIKNPTVERAFLADLQLRKKGGGPQARPPRNTFSRRTASAARIARAGKPRGGSELKRSDVPVS
jgi:hypothetical protein